MATDITTLAIQLQSKEAESGLKTFNDLLTAGSKNAKGMEHMTIGVDVDEAVRQLSVFKASFDNIATAAQNIHFDLGMNMPTMLAPPPVEPAHAPTSISIRRIIRASCGHWLKSAVA